MSGRFNWERIRTEVLERDDYTCQDCGHEADPELKNYERDIALHVDHIKPVAQSGIMWDKDNLVTLCEDCHREKSRSNDDYTAQRKETRLQAFTDDNPVTRGEQVWADNYASVPTGQLRYWERTLARLHREFNKPDYAPRKLSVSRRQQVLTELMDEMLEHVDQGDNQ